MSGRLEGKVAFVTGAARGQGRSHAIRMAQEGADIIAVDICDQVATVPYLLATEDDLSRTAKEVEALGRRVVASPADVRDADQLARVLDQGVSQLGHLDIVSANAGIYSVGPSVELAEAAWQDMIDINLTGVWHTTKVATPHLIKGDRGGSIVLTSSVNGVVGAPMYSHYVAAKHGVIGLMRSLSIELAPHRIRVNAILPGGVATDMISRFKDIGTSAVRYDEDLPGDALSGKPFLSPSDISDGLMFLVSDEARYVTGLLLHIDGHALIAAARAGS